MTSLTQWRGKKMSEAVCHILAGAVAREEFPLSENERRAVDTWLDERYPVRTNKEGRTDAPSLFDDLPMAW